MKSSAIFFFACILLAVFTSRSETPFDFGRVSDEEIDLEYYRAKYPGEPAVIIADIADSKFTFNNSSRRFQYIFNREIRLIILDELGLGYGDFPIYYYQGPNGSEEIQRLRGHIYNREGNRVRRTRINQRAGYTNDAGNNIKEFIIPFPEVRPGSIIELRYQIASDFLFNMRSWRFQWEIPVEHSEYVVNLPSFFNYMARFKGFFELDVNEQQPTIETFRYTQQIQNYGQKIDGQTYNLTTPSTRFRWVTKDLPGMKEEPFTDNIYNYLGHIYFEMVSEEFPDMEPKHYTTTWQDVSKHMMDRDEFGKYLQDAAMASRHFVPPGTFNSEIEAIRWALNEISSNITWDEDAARYADKTPSEVVNRGFGNSAEINLMLVALLRNLNLQAYPVVTSTVDNGELFSESPTISQWDYVVVQVRIPGKEPILLDATVHHPIPGYLPQRAINGRGRLIDPQLNEWVNLESNINQELTKKYNLRLDEMGNLNGELNYQYEGFGAYNLMQELAKNNDEDILKSFARKTGAAISNFNIEKSDTLNPKITVNADIFIPDYAQSLGNELIIPALLFETLEDNPFTAPDRLYPITFPHTGTNRIIFEIELPENMKVSHLPDSKKSARGRFSYEYIFEKENNKLILQATNQNTTRIVNASRYNSFRSFMERMINDNADNILLEVR